MPLDMRFTLEDVAAIEGKFSDYSGADGISLCAEIQDGGRFLLVEVRFSQDSSIFQAQRIFIDLSGHMKIFSGNGDEKYSWMVLISKNGEVIDVQEG